MNHLRAAPIRHASLEILKAEKIDRIIAPARRRYFEDAGDRFNQFIRPFRVNKTTKLPIQQCLARSIGLTTHHRNTTRRGLYEDDPEALPLLGIT